MPKLTLTLRHKDAIWIGENVRVALHERDDRDNVRVVIEAPAEVVICRDSNRKPKEQSK